MKGSYRSWLAWILFGAIAFDAERASAGTFQGAAPAQPAQSAASATPSKLETLLEPVRAKFEVPALAAAVVSSERLLAIGAVGERERGGGVAVTVDDRWHLGSCTKAMTATLAARFVESGNVKWSTTVGEVFGDQNLGMHAAWRDVTLEWLLQNRGGAPGAPPPELWRDLWQRSGSARESRRWFVDQLLASEPAATPGTKFIYSNQGFTIAGAMLEHLSGQAWEQLMREHVFEPLGMSSAGFGPPGSADKVDQPRGHTKQVHAPGPSADNPAAIGPAGTVHASIGDWAKFAAAHLRGARGENDVLKSETFARLQTPPNGESYAMGWGRAKRDWAKGDTLSHSGSNTMWYCVVWIAPSVDRALLVASNAGGDQAVKACDAALQKLIEHQQLR